MSTGTPVSPIENTFPQRRGTSNADSPFLKTRVSPEVPTGTLPPPLWQPLPRPTVFREPLSSALTRSVDSLASTPHGLVSKEGVPGTGTHSARRWSGSLSAQRKGSALASPARHARARKVRRVLGPTARHSRYPRRPWEGPAGACLPRLRGPILPGPQCQPPHSNGRARLGIGSNAVASHSNIRHSRPRNCLGRAGGGSKTVGTFLRGTPSTR